MKFRVTLMLPRGRSRDLTLACDVTATVADVARTLLRAGVSDDPQLEDIAAHHRAPVTLLGRSSDAREALLLDPGAAVGSSGLRSGWIIEPVLEFDARGSHRRIVETAGIVDVLSGAHAGARYSLVAGTNLIGRERGCRIHLSDGSVSRRHAAIEVGPDLRLRDLGSANGIVIDGKPVTECGIVAPCTLTLGDVAVRITPDLCSRSSGVSRSSEVSGPLPLSPSCAPAPRTSDDSPRVMHTRSPRIDTRFPASERLLPEPPARPASHRIPLVAMLAPMMMGGVMYAVTQSPMSLMMVAFSPLMIIGSWIDARLGATRRLRRELRQFMDSLEAERAELLALEAREIEVRAAESPTLDEVSTAIEERNGLLWARRPEHSSFLQVRFGDGSLPSRTRVALPSRGKAEQQQWEEIRRLASEFDEVAPVPVRERFARCGSIGVVGEATRAAGMARALVMQLIGLHSPAELTLACVAGPSHLREWEWLKWLPHVDPPNGVLPGWQLADDPASTTRLLIALETLLELRQARAGSRATVRSRLPAGSGTDDDTGGEERELPMTPAVLVLVLDDGRLEQSRLIAIAEAGPDVGIHLLWMTSDQAQLPASCRTFVTLDLAEANVSYVRAGTVVALERVASLSATEAQTLARRLSPVEDASARALDETDLPASVRVSDLSDIDLLGGGSPILRAWMRSGTLTSQWRLGIEREPVALAAVVGQGVEGPVAVDLRRHGPHALVGGTTGSGKSEFLQTWIMSLAARISPDRVTFLLVDYKGGAAFAECTELPHSVGLVTDLSPHLVRRALASLRAELRFREELLAAHGAKDLVAMERRSDPQAPPALVIVIDEFAALVKDVPEFVDGVIDVAQRGRSLGLHLILATQRPGGVVTDNLRANANLRVALRMADEVDSVDVLGVADAAFFDAEHPGRAALKAGAGRIGHFQTGHLGGRAAPLGATPAIEVRTLGFTEGDLWPSPGEPTVHEARRSHPRDIEQLRDGIIEAARTAGLASPRRPWLDVLPEELDLHALIELDTRQGRAHPAGQSRDAAVIGVQDIPATQSQPLIAIDLESAGNVSIIGAGGTGKTSALITLACALSMRAEQCPVQLYVIDAAGGVLDMLAELPTVGAVSPSSDRELVGRILRRLLDLIAERGPRYAGARAGNLEEYRAVAGADGSGGAGSAGGDAANEARVVLLLDGFSAFRQASEAQITANPPLQLLSEIMATGRAVGVHVVLTGDRPSALPAALASTVQRQLVLRLASRHEYGFAGAKSDILEHAPPGRAVLAGRNDEIQLAVIGGRGALVDQAEAVGRLATRLRESGVEDAPEIRNAPEVVHLQDLPVSDRGRPVYGLDVRTLEPVSLPTRGLAVVSGPAGSGQSTAALSCVSALRRWAKGRGETLDSVLLTFADDGLCASPHWDRVACGEHEVRDLARELVAALGRRPPAAASGVPPGGVIVVERPAGSEGTEALGALVALARAARRADALVLFEFEQGTGAAIWELFAALRQPSWGLALQPDEAETQTPFREPLGRVKRTDYPPGRGFAIRNGLVTPVQVAHSWGILED